MSSRPFAWQLFQNCGTTEGKFVLLKGIQVYQTFCLELKLETRTDPVSVLTSVYLLITNIAREKCTGQEKIRYIYGQIAAKK